MEAPVPKYIKVPLWTTPEGWRVDVDVGEDAVHVQLWMDEDSVLPTARECVLTGPAYRFVQWFIAWPPFQSIERQVYRAARRLEARQRGSGGQPRRLKMAAKLRGFRGAKP